MLFGFVREEEFIDLHKHAYINAVPLCVGSMLQMCHALLNELAS